MAKRGKTTAILLATGAVVVVVVGVVSFWGDIVWFFQSDAERIQGRWKVVSAVLDGHAQPERELGYCTFEGEKMTSHDLHGSSSLYHHLDENQSPPWFDLRFPDSCGSGLPGIYKLERDNLTICLDQGRGRNERPTAFESKTGTPNDILIVLERE